MNTAQFQKTANQMGSQKKPFFFIIDFEMKKPFVCSPDEAADHGFYYNVKGFSNYTSSGMSEPETSLDPAPINKEKYRKAFGRVMNNLKGGNTYLLNLTFPTPLKNSPDFSAIFEYSPASYKLLHEKDFVLFSPECFIQITNDQIHSFLMKGTIDASIPNAEQVILNNEKEFWKHNTIVDLIRNDLSIVAKNVHVPHFRYIERIKTSYKELLQVSSQIKGDLPEDWPSRIGEILLQLLPAGSISGAPKAKTTEIIRESEGQDRGYFTSIFGIFDGHNLNSAVNIRFIENTGKGYQFRSGGRITAKSDMDEEYEEMINKVYVPLA